MNSCDTFALTAGCFDRGVNVLAKNSDRPLGEAQPLYYQPPQTHPAGAQLACTHITIPQAAQTYGVLGCKPWWIWGFEMGVNQWGLAIGNEAQGSRCDAEAQDGLLGMDLLRLGLERARTAREAIGVITGLLERYGQNGNASPLFDRRYENSFLLVDPRESWLLETAGRQWVARQVRDWAAISNCYSISTDWELCSPDLEHYARSRRWLAPDAPLDFAAAYTAPATRQTAATPRWRRLNKCIAAGLPLGVEGITQILRDHFEGELMEPRFGGCYGGFVSICMHAMTWDAAQTTASLITWVAPGVGVVGRYAPAIPCCSVYLPVYPLQGLPRAMVLGEGTYCDASLWWRSERLAMAISIDEARFGDPARKALRELEQQLLSEAEALEARVVTMSPGEAEPLLTALMARSCGALMELLQSLTQHICTQVAQLGGLYGPRKEFLEDYCRRTGMQLS